VTIVNSRVSAKIICAYLLLGCAQGDDALQPLTAAYAETECGSCEEWNAPQDPFQVHGNTYYVGTRGLAALLITSDAGHVLIDAALPNSAPRVRESIQALGYSVKDVKIILNSHAHFDHAGGIAAIQLLSGARVIASPQSAAIIRRGNSGPEDPQYPGLLDFPAVTVVEELADGVSITLGDLTLTPHLTPAHVPGGTTWTWRSCSAALADCVDVVYGDSQSLLSREGYRFSESADLEGIARGFGTLEGLSCDILVTPHPGQSSFWERLASPTGLTDRSACQRYVAAARERLVRRLAGEPARAK